MKCLGCGYIKKTDDQAPDDECPACGRIYSKFRPQKTVVAPPNRGSRKLSGPEIVVGLIAGVFGIWATMQVFEDKEPTSSIQTKNPDVSQQRRVQQQEIRRETSTRDRAATARDPMQQETQRKQRLQLDVASLCQVAIRRSLGDPRSANFDFYGSYRWQENPNNLVLMFPTLRAKNARGGQEKMVYACEVTVANRQALRITHLERL